MCIGWKSSNKMTLVSSIIFYPISGDFQPLFKKGMKNFSFLANWQSPKIYEAIWHSLQIAQILTKVLQPNLAF